MFHRQPVVATFATPIRHKGWLQKSRQAHTLCYVFISAATVIAASRSRRILGKEGLLRRLKAWRPSCDALFRARVLTTRGRSEIYMCHDLCNDPTSLLCGRTCSYFDRHPQVSMILRARESFVTSQSPRVKVWYSAQRQSPYDATKARDLYSP